MNIEYGGCDIISLGKLVELEGSGAVGKTG